MNLLNRYPMLRQRNLNEGEVYKIHTSDRRKFKRCRLAWAFSSPLRGRLRVKSSKANINMWFGSGGHFALEDYFGYNHFGLPEMAFAAYYDACSYDELPEGAGDMFDLGIHLLEYFRTWWEQYNKNFNFITLWVVPNEDGTYTPISYEKSLALSKKEMEIEGAIPAIELSGSLDMPDVHPDAVYHFTIDRCLINPANEIYIQDYKFMKNVKTDYLDADPQITAYLWAIELILQYPVKAMVYTQIKKTLPEKPEVLKNGNLSTRKTQKTTAALYKKAIEEIYGSVEEAPEKVQKTLEHFQMSTDLYGDTFIRGDHITRSRQQKAFVYHQIMAESKDMLTPDLSLYPAPTWDCGWECSYKEMCLAICDQRAIDDHLEDFEERQYELDRVPDWRARIEQMYTEEV